MVTAAQIKGGLMGVCVADALGVPVEFSTREERHSDPVISMRGFGTYNQPPGTWSDDSSLTFCLAEAIAEVGLGDELPEHLGRKMGLWLEQSYWTPHGETFDVGQTTAIAIRKILSGVSPLEAGGSDERSNGNGSLMRILPLAFFADMLPYAELLDLTHNISSLTHRHPRSLVACGIYLSIAIELLKNQDLTTAYELGIRRSQEFYSNSIYHNELEHYEDVLLGSVGNLSIEEIESSGYVVHTLEASLWCCLNNGNYADTVLAAVNLGDDTDTTAAIAGGLAGIYYGLDNIPDEWQKLIHHHDEILTLGDRLFLSMATTV
ncbi:ADP-ribosylation/Crystallin J1 [[Leptolyngbya] sp. PCC 7376]|uniref:ADP-ribosylglycohydrolase family protein n=1 Tax=[Leptolyngbya] sp. PCC 7376 TaxID=111781 RepID=UPI00029EFB60|nr:ADP-ribosylglycohydrolase family protein [[Leptolyngbya] sp. PCC 7376]AFY39019.1 ADP-ribosylation/Crystallin J1 [[Leptolyngbya] sp. PCC 7376]